MAAANAPPDVPRAADARMAVVLGWVAIALALARFLRLGDWGLWIDEAHTLNDALALFRAPPRPYPLGYLAVLGTVRLFGGAQDEATLRLAPAVFGCLAIPVAAWSVRPALGALRANAVAVLLGASSWQLFWSQNARGYSLALLLVLFGLGLWLRGLLGGRRGTLIAGLALAASAAFAHPSAALLLPGLVLAPCAVLALGVRPAVRPPVWLLAGLAAIGTIVLGSWALTVWGRYEAVKAGSSWMHLGSTTVWYMGPLMILGAGLGVLLAWRARSARELYIACAALIAGGLALGASLFAKVAAQYVFVLLPLVAILATRPLADLRRPLARWAWILLLAAPGLLQSALYFSVRHGDRPRWKEAYAFIQERRSSEDLVLAMHAPVGEYYLRPGKGQLRDQVALQKLEEHTAGHPDLWRRRGRRIWIVVNPEDLMAWSPQARGRFNRLLANEAQLQAEFDVPWTPRDMRVRVYSL